MKICMKHSVKNIHVVKQLMRCASTLFLMLIACVLSLSVSSCDFASDAQGGWQTDAKVPFYRIDAKGQFDLDLKKTNDDGGNFTLTLRCNPHVPNGDGYELSQTLTYQVKGAWSIPDGDLALNFDMNTAKVKINKIEFIQGEYKTTLEDYMRDMLTAAGDRDEAFILNYCKGYIGGAQEAALNSWKEWLQGQINKHKEDGGTLKCSNTMIDSSSLTFDLDGTSWNFRKVR